MGKLFNLLSALYGVDGLQQLASDNLVLALLLVSCFAVVFTASRFLAEMALHVTPPKVLALELSVRFLRIFVCGALATIGFVMMAMPFILLIAQLLVGILSYAIVHVPVIGHLIMVESRPLILAILIIGLSVLILFLLLPEVKAESSNKLFLSAVALPFALALYHPAINLAFGYKPAIVGIVLGGAILIFKRFSDRATVAPPTAS